MMTKKLECEDVVFLPEGVSEEFAERSGLGFGYITHDCAAAMLLPRAYDAHKGSSGHALLICGSRGMMGAATLATGAALRSGCGLVTAHIPESERFPVEANHPSALISLDEEWWFTTVPDSLEKYTAIGIGCGLGVRPETVAALRDVLVRASDMQNAQVKVVLDADALNILAVNADMQSLIPRNSILTPHAGELRRLVGDWDNEEDKILKISAFARATGTILVAKGPNTMVCVRGESVAFNSSGNAGMAKGGSGDVLTGFITGLLARGYEPEVAAKLGVYVHGVAGDAARDYFGEEAMNSADLIDFLAEGMQSVK